MKKTTNYKEYIINRSVEDESGCWVWQGSFQKSGKRGQLKYGSMRYNKKTSRVHRVVYELYYGVVPGDLYVCHKCDNTKCVNPEHLFLGTQKDNMQDKLRKNRDHNKRKTHCPYGHEYSGKNLIKRKSGARSCRKCMRLAWNKHDEKNRDIKKMYALFNYYYKSSERRCAGGNCNTI